MRERAKQWRQKVTSFLEKHIKPQSIQMTIALSLYDCICHQYGYSGDFLYKPFVNKMEDMTTQSKRSSYRTRRQSIWSYLRNMRRISDAMYLQRY